MADILRPEAAAGGRSPQSFTEFPGWHFADGWTTGRLMESQTGAFAITMVKDGHMVVLMRGSTTDEVRSGLMFICTPFSIGVPPFLFLI